MVLGI